MSLARIFATILGVAKKFSYFFTNRPQITQIFTDFYLTIKNKLAQIGINYSLIFF